MNGSGRPVADSPEYKGDLFFIEVPDSLNPGKHVVHKVSTTIKDHQDHMDRMHNAGNHDFIERKVKR